MLPRGTSITERFRCPSRGKKPVKSHMYISVYIYIYISGRWRRHAFSLPIIYLSSARNPRFDLSDRINRRRGGNAKWIQIKQPRGNLIVLNTRNKYACTSVVGNNQLLDIMTHTTCGATVNYYRKIIGSARRRDERIRAGAQYSTSAQDLSFPPFVGRPRSIARLSSASTITSAVRSRSKFLPRRLNERLIVQRE